MAGDGDGGNQVPQMTVTIDGTEHQIPVPDGFLTAAAVAEKYMPKGTFESELGRRAASIARDKLGMVKPDDLLTNDEFVAKIIEQHGLVKKGSGDGDGDGGGTKAPTAEQIATMQEEWRNKELTPVQEQVQKDGKRIQGLLTKMLTADIVRAGAVAGVKERFLKPAAPGQDPPIVSMLGPMFRYDQEHDAFFVAKGEDGFEVSSDPKVLETGVPYRGPAEFIAAWAGLQENKDFVDASAGRGANLDLPAGTQVSGRDVLITREQAGDHGEYLRAEVIAKKQGGRVIVKDAPVYGATGGGAAGGV